MLKKNFYFFLAIFFVFAFTPKATENVDLDMVYKIKREGLSNSTVRDLSYYLTDYLGPRLSGSSNLRRARNWSAEKFKEWGLQNVKIDSYGEFGRGWDIKKSYLAMTTPYYQQLIATPKAWTDGTDGPVSSEVVLVKIDSEEDFAKYKGKLKGKVVTLPSTLSVTTSFDPSARRWTDEQLDGMKEVSVNVGGGRTPMSPAQLAQMRNARALNQKINDFFLEEGVALKLTGTRGSFGTVFHSTGGSYSTDKRKTLPELELSAEHWGRMVRLIENGQTVSVDAEVQVEWLDDDYKGYNVLAEIPGTDKNLKSEIVLLGAHLDSWHAGTGANDNGAGVIVMMEAIRILKALGVQPKRTIRIALWGEEEQGLYGSRGYIQKYVADRQTYEKKGEWDKISAYYNLDNGSGKIRGINTQSNDAVVPIFESWFAPFHELGAKTIANRSVGSTDHVAFEAVGIPGFQFIQDPIDYGRGYHTNMDVYERLQMADMAQAATIVASLVYNTAQRDEKLPRKPWGKQ